MKHWISHIIYRTLGILLVVLTVATARAQKPVIDMGDIPQCETTTFSVVDWPGDRYTWDLYRDSTVNFAHTKGDVDPAIYFEKDMYEGSTVNINWLDPGRYFLRVMVWDEVSCTNNLLLFKINVVEMLPELILIGDSVCEDETAIVKVIFTGKGPWEATYTYGDGLVTYNLNGTLDQEEQTIEFLPYELPLGTTDFWVMEVTDDCTVNSYEIDPPKIGVVIYPLPSSSKIYLKDD